MHIFEQNSILRARVYFKDFFGLHNTPLPSRSLLSPPIPSIPLPLEVGPLKSS